MANSSNVAVFLEKNRSLMVSVGLHILLLLLFLNMIVMRHELKTPTFTTRLIQQQQIVDKKVIPLKRKEAGGGTKGLSGERGGGMSSSMFQEKLMVRQETQRNVIDQLFKPVSNIRTKIQDMFVPQKIVAVDSPRARSSFEIGPQDFKSFSDRTVSSPGVGRTNRTKGDRDTSGMSVYGRDAHSGNPNSRGNSEGVGNNKFGSTGMGGGGQGGWLGGSGRGSGSYGKGPGAGDGGWGDGSGGDGVGPGSGPGNGPGTGPGEGGGPTDLGFALGGGPQINPVTQNIQIINVNIDNQLGTETNPVTELILAVETEGTAVADHDFGMAYPENRMLLRNAKTVTRSAVRVGPFTIPPERFVFFLNVRNLGDGLPDQTYSTDRDVAQFRIVRISQVTVQYWWEDIPISNPRCDRDTDDVVVTVTFAGSRSR